MEKLLVGVDGGGSKTDVVITDQDENLLWEGKTQGGGNVAVREMTEIVNEVWQTIKRGLQEINYQVQDVGAIGMGVSALNSELQQQKLIAKWAEINKEGIKTEIVNDTVIAMLSATEAGANELEFEFGTKRPVITQIIGTGMNCRGKNQDGLEVGSGGVDYVGDQGSGFEVGYQSLRAVVASEDGRERPTVLVKLLREAYEFEHWSDLIAVLCPPRTGWQKNQIAKIGELCFRAEADFPEDEVIAEIVIKAVSDSFIAVVAVANRLGIKKEDEFDLVWAGGMIKYRDNYREKLTALVQNYYPKVKIWLPEKDPVWGAIRLAKKISEKASH